MLYRGEILPGKMGFASRGKWGYPTFLAPTPLFLAMIWVFGCILPVGAPRIIKMRKGEIPRSAWPLFSFCFFFFLRLFIIDDFRNV